MSKNQLLGGRGGAAGLEGITLLVDEPNILEPSSMSSARGFRKFKSFSIIFSF